MKYLILILCFCITACEKSLEIEQDNKIVILKVDEKEITGIFQKIESRAELQEVTRKEGCETPGFCCKCGFTMDLDHECSCDFWRNCDGRQEVTYQIQDYTYRTEYVMTNKQKLYSPIRAGQDRKVINETQCEL